MQHSIERDLSPPFDGGKMTGTPVSCWQPVELPLETKDTGDSGQLRVPLWLRPLLLIAVLLAVWQVAIDRHPAQLLPGPVGVASGILDLMQHGLLLKYVVASLFRVTWGFGLAALLAIPLGLMLGWYRRGEMAIYPLVQVFRPISPLAWIPVAILWFGVGDLAAIFLIFVGCFFPCSADGNERGP
jgi:NitT/TauT family transport system permease protein